MKLREYKIQNGLSINELALLLDAPDASVKAWLYSGRMPRKLEMHKIYQRTNGNVTPNDFVLDGEEIVATDPDPPPEDTEDEEPAILAFINQQEKTAAAE